MPIAMQTISTTKYTVDSYLHGPMTFSTTIAFQQNDRNFIYIFQNYFQEIRVITRIQIECEQISYFLC